jgi:hypothetical protein
MDLKTKLKDFVPDGEWKNSLDFSNEQLFSACSDDQEVSKVLKEINYAIKQAHLERRLKEVKCEFLNILVTHTHFMPMTLKRIFINYVYPLSAVKKVKRQSNNS